MIVDILILQSKNGAHTHKRKGFLSKSQRCVLMFWCWWTHPASSCAGMVGSLWDVVAGECRNHAGYMPVPVAIEGILRKQQINHHWLDQSIVVPQGPMVSTTHRSFLSCLGDTRCTDAIPYSWVFTVVSLPVCGHFLRQRRSAMALARYNERWFSWYHERVSLLNRNQLLH